MENANLAAIYRKKAERILETIFGVILSYLGILWLVKQLYRHRCKIPIIMYHSINEDMGKNHTPSCLSLNRMVVKSDILKKHIKFLSKRYKIISLEDMLDAIKKKNRNDLKDALVITFDDGFKDNYDNAFPILKRYGCRAIVFLIGETITSENFVWLHRLYRVLDDVEICKIPPGINGLKSEYRLETKNKRDLMERLVKHLNGISIQEKTDFLENFEKINNYEGNSLEYYLTENEMRIMRDHGISFGAHSMRHFNLTSIEPKKLEIEIKESVSIVKNIMQDEMIAFAYPFGVKGSWNESVIDVLKKNGVSCALSTIEGLNGLGSNTYELKRIEMRNFNRFELVLHVSGIVGFVKSVAKRILRRN